MKNNIALEILCAAATRRRMILVKLRHAAALALVWGTMTKKALRCLLLALLCAGCVPPAVVYYMPDHPELHLAGWQCPKDSGHWIAHTNPVCSWVPGGVFFKSCFDEYAASSYEARGCVREALPLVRWYLMEPPVGHCVSTMTREPCAEGPLSEWVVITTYDSATTCEYAKEQNAPKAQRYLADATRNRQRDTRVSTEQAVYMSYLAEKCVASDDPRLKRK
jgi:hypothetical protein